LDLYETIFEVIDMRSFSNLWYWIALAVTWSTASHFVIGVPFDLVLRARRKGGDAAQDLEVLVRINCNRLQYIGEVAGLWLLTLVSAVLSALLVLGFWYGVEFAQALVLLALPLSGVMLLSLSTARLIVQAQLSGEALHARLARHRLYVQIIGMSSIFVTAIWGMYQNLNLGPLGA
jgi:hypothetical protein